MVYYPSFDLVVLCALVDITAVSVRKTSFPYGVFPSDIKGEGQIKSIGAPLFSLGMIAKLKARSFD